MTPPRAKASIFDIHPYMPGRSGAPATVKLSSNENALGCSPAARAAFLQAAATLSRYPDARAAALRAALAERHRLAASGINFGAGSDEIFALVCQAFLEPGCNIVQPEFGFAAWAIAARAAGGAVKPAPERDYHVDVDALLDAVDVKTRIVFVANPANPTGTMTPFSEIERLHARLPEDVILVLDGAYAEFAEARADYSAGFNLARDADNVLVTRTFSKIYGLAALRVGWGYSSALIADALDRARLPFNASAPAQAAALAALDDEAFLAASVRSVESGRARLSNFLASLGFRTLPATANFVTALTPPESPLSAGDIIRRLEQRGVNVRGLANYGMPDAIRVTVGTEGELTAFETALGAVLDEN